MMKDQPRDPRQWNEAGDVVRRATDTGKTAAMRTWQPGNGAGDAGSQVHTEPTGLQQQQLQQKFEEPKGSATELMSFLMADVYCCYVMSHCQTAEVTCLNCKT